MGCSTSKSIKTQQIIKKPISKELLYPVHIKKFEEYMNSKASLRAFSNETHQTIESVCTKVLKSKLTLQEEAKFPSFNLTFEKIRKLAYGL